MGGFSENLNIRSSSRDFDFGTIILSLAMSWVLFYVLKNFLRRLKYAGLPGPKFYFFDIFGILRLLYSISDTRTGYSIKTYAMQFAEAIGRLYPNDAFVFGWIGSHPIVLVNKPEAVQAIMTDSSMVEKPFLYKFPQPVIGKGLVTSIGSKWKPRRRMLNPSYHVSILMDFMPIFNEHGGKLVKKLQEGTDGEVVELLKPISLCVLDIVCETILGTKIGAQDNMNKDYVDGLRSVFSITMERIITFWQWPGLVFRYSKNGRKFNKDLVTVHEFTHSVLMQKKKEYLAQGPNLSGKRRPLMDILLEFHMEKKNITEEGIIEEVDTFTAASNESTAASLLFTLNLVGLDKTIQANAHQELDEIFGDDRERPVEKEDLTKMNYIECILKESLRLFPTVPMFGRELPAEKTLCGYKLPKGTIATFFPYVLHRDPSIFPDPERFDPSRFFPENCAKRSQYAYIPFSAGARNCIGQKFAMIEMKVVLAHILRNFTVESLDPRDKVLAAPELSLRTDIELRFKLFART